MRPRCRTFLLIVPTCPIDPEGQVARYVQSQFGVVTVTFEAARCGAYCGLVAVAQVDAADR